MGAPAGSPHAGCWVRWSAANGLAGALAGALLFSVHGAIWSPLSARLPFWLAQALTLAAVAAGAGAVLATGQWLTLRRRLAGLQQGRSRGWWWIPAGAAGAALGWPVGVGLGMLTTTAAQGTLTDLGPALDPVVRGAFLGATVGAGGATGSAAIQGLVLRRLRLAGGPVGAWSTWLLVSALAGAAGGAAGGALLFKVGVQLFDPAWESVVATLGAPLVWNALLALSAGTAALLAAAATGPLLARLLPPTGVPPAGVHLDRREHRPSHAGGWASPP